MNELMTFSTQELLYYLVSLPLLLCSFIGFKKWFSKTISTSFDFNKHHFLVGGAVALISCIAFINWETTTSGTEYRSGPLEDVFTVILDCPITYHKKREKKTPPPVKAKRLIRPISLTKINLVKNVETHEETPLPIESDDIPIAPVLLDTSSAPMTLPVPAKKEETTPFVSIAEQMPRFPGCENLEWSNKEKETCSKGKLLNYIYKNLKYPAVARENGIEGMVVIRFTVNTEGKIINVELLRDIGAGCGNAAVKVVESMNNLPENWEPGRQRGQAVNVLYTLPVKFKLQ